MPFINIKTNTLFLIKRKQPLNLNSEKRLLLFREKPKTGLWWVLNRNIFFTLKVTTLLPLW